MSAVTAEREAPRARSRSARSPADRAGDLRNHSWPLARLGEGLEALARRCGLEPRGGEPLQPPEDAAVDDRELARWMSWAGERLGVASAPVHTDVSGLRALLAGAGPAVVRLPALDGPRFLLLLPPSRRGPRLLSPDLRAQAVDPSALEALVAHSRDRGTGRDVARLLDVAGIAAHRRPGLRSALMRRRNGSEPIDGIWSLRVPAEASFPRQLLHAGVGWRLAAMLGLAALGYGLEIGGWGLVGHATIEGQLDLGWIAAWTLLLLTLVPLHAGVALLGARIGVDAGALLKARLLAGSLRAGTDAVRRDGAGQLLARVMESQALEGATLAAGLSSLVAVVEVGFAGALLALGPGGPALAALLLAWTLASFGLAARFSGRIAEWARDRRTLTEDLVDRMVGHRTVLAQDRPERRHGEDDAALLRSLGIAANLDRASLPLLVALPMTWTIAALALLTPSFVNGAGPASLAVSLGAILLAGRGLTGLAGGLAAAGRAWAAWAQVAPLFRIADPEGPARAFVPLRALAGAEGTPVVDAEALVYRRGPRDPLVLSGASLSVRPGARILLEGPSGGGKSTLVSMLSGLRDPDSGLLLVNGFDRQVLGTAWQEIVSQAPQFGDNHVFGGSLAFNLLMGRQWPPTRADLDEARDVCLDLGLGDLLDRMPSGLMQQVGETGWQLSHGERSRVFLARALLQRAQLVILDESFGALDPATLAQCLRTAFARAPTLIVVAHP